MADKNLATLFTFHNMPAVLYIINLQYTSFIFICHAIAAPDKMLVIYLYKLTQSDFDK